jgi:CheY-like chemotaxis protein
MDAQGKRVLVIDDDPDFVLATKTMLAGAGYVTDECSSGRLALAKIREFKPDLVILDVMMETGSAGFYVAQEVRKLPEYAHLPILMVTAIHRHTTVRFSPDTDGDYLPVEKFIDKPVAADLLLKEVAALLARK